MEHQIQLISLLQFIIKDEAMRSKNKKKQQIVVLPPQPPQPVRTLPQKMQHLLGSVQVKISDLIDHEQLTISSKKKPYLAQPDKQKIVGNKLKKLKQEKETIEMKLQEIIEKQKQTKDLKRYLSIEKHKHARNPLITSRDQSLTNSSGLYNSAGDESYYSHRAKSELSAKDVNLLRKLKREQRQFEDSLLQKTRLYNQQMEKWALEEKQLKTKEKQEQLEKKKIAIQESLKEIQKRKIERQKQFQDEKKKLIQVKTKKKLFQEWEKQYKQSLEQQFSTKLSRINESFKAKDLNLKTIQEHSEKYEALKNIRQQERKEKLKKLIEEEKLKKSMVQPQKSRFYELILQEKKKKQKEQRDKQRYKEENMQAMREYAQKIKLEYLPKLHTKQTEENEPPPKKQSMDIQERKKIGNAYFQQIRPFLQKMKEKKAKREQRQYTIDSSKSDRYKDYLRQSRISRQKKGGNKRQNHSNESDDYTKTIKDTQILNRLATIDKIMKSNEPKQHKLQRVRAIAETLQTYNNKGDRFIQNIAAKIRILETIRSQEG